MCFDHNLVQWSGAVWQGFSARASGVCAQKKRTSDQRANEMFNRQGWYVNNALLRSWISAVCCQSNSTAVSRVVHYIETEARTVTDRKCAVARYNDISKSMHSYCHYLVYMSSSDEGSIIRIFVQINILERRASYVVLMDRVSISLSDNRNSQIYKWKPFYWEPSCIKIQHVSTERETFLIIMFRRRAAVCRNVNRFVSVNCSVQR